MQITEKQLGILSHNRGIVKASVDDDIKDMGKMNLNFTNLSKEQAKDLIETIYKLEEAYSDEKDADYAKYKIQIINTLSNLI